MKAKRFDKDETISPGPAAYKLPDSCQVKNPQIKMASYRSEADRDLNFIVGKDNPGVGQYNTGEQKAIGTTMLKGGGAPNNFTVGYPNSNPTIRNVETVVKPRLPDLDLRSKSPTYVSVKLISCCLAPLDVGPGSYLMDSADLKAMERFKFTKLPQATSNWSSSPRFAKLSAQTP